MEAFKGMIEVMSQLVDDCAAMMKLISGEDRYIPYHDRRSVQRVICQITIEIIIEIEDLKT